jgi:hypothetical protein
MLDRVALDFCQGLLSDAKESDPGMVVQLVAGDQSGEIHLDAGRPAECIGQHPLGSN